MVHDDTERGGGHQPKLLLNNILTNAKIVVANLSCSAKIVLVKEKRWLCQGIEASCNALVSVLRLYSKVYIGYLQLLPSFYIIHT